MHRIVKRIVSLFVSGLVVAACISACASEEETYDSAKALTGKCTPNFCPEVPAGKRCCITDTQCGADMGMGCVAVQATPDAG